MNAVNMKNKIFIATSFDGYIADQDGSVDWLTQIPNPTNSDAGFSEFMKSIDALLMGRNTFEKVLSFEIEWPYSKKVFVWSSKLTAVPNHLVDKVEIVSGGIKEVLELINGQGFSNLYIDGGKTIQSFMNEGLIHEMIITLTPIILGRGIPLFENAPKTNLLHLRTETFDNGFVQTHFEVKFNIG